MHEDHASSFLVVIAFLAAAVLFVPIFKRLGLGAVLGYLFAGVLLGPSVLGVTEEPKEIMEFAELGVVFLLFLIGLELNPQRLWSMRRDIFGLGALQVLVCGAIMTLYPLFAAGMGWKAALVAGLGLALSSTALVMQIIEERGAMRLPYGQKTFAVLLMQDIAIVPLLVVVTMLAPGEEMHGSAVGLAVLKGVAAVGAIILVGHYLLSPLFRLLARFGGREIMTAAALLIVLASGTVMMQVGLSMAMGAFLAGVLLAESNYRHELEADIQPFRGLLLGLFFISVGMSIDLSLVVSEWALILGGVAFIIIGKGVAVYALVRAFGGDHWAGTKSAILLSQGGEFGFVLFTAAAAEGVMTSANSSLLIAAVILSMATTPFLIRFLPPLLATRPVRATALPDEDFSDAGGDVLVIGFGRFGQIVSQMLLAAGFRPTLIDNDPDRVTEARRFGNRVYYGDGTRLDVLRAAGGERCRLIAVCTSPAEVTTTIVDLVKDQFPHCRLFARAFDRRHALTLFDHQVDYQRRETFDGAVRFGRDALVALGLEETRAKETEIEVRRRDRDRLEFQRIEGFVEGHRKWREVTPQPYTPSAPDDESEARKEAAE
jgi:monovalent cation:proton antiporter-2 (CPA2) family protein